MYHNANLEVCLCVFLSGVQFITVVYAFIYKSFLVILSSMIISYYSVRQLWIYAYFIGIVFAGLQGQTWFALMFLTMFSLSSLGYRESTLRV